MQDAAQGARQSSNTSDRALSIASRATPKNSMLIPANMPMAQAAVLGTCCRGAIIINVCECTPRELTVTHTHSVRTYSDSLVLERGKRVGSLTMLHEWPQAKRG